MIVAGRASRAFLDLAGGTCLAPDVAAAVLAIANGARGTGSALDEAARPAAVDGAGGPLCAVLDGASPCHAIRDGAGGILPARADGTAPLGAGTVVTGGLGATARQGAAPTAGVDVTGVPCTTLGNAASSARTFGQVASALRVAACHRTSPGAAGYRAVAAVTGHRTIARIRAVHVAGGSGAADSLAAAIGAGAIHVAS